MLLLLLVSNNLPDDASKACKLGPWQGHVAFCPPELNTKRLKRFGQPRTIYPSGLREWAPIPLLTSGVEIIAPWEARTPDLEVNSLTL